MKKINRTQALMLINKHYGEFFTVGFTKRSTGEFRKMKCRLGVTKDLKGGELKFNPIEKQLLTVYDIEKAGYRSIPLDNLEQLTIHKQTYEVV